MSLMHFSGALRVFAGVLITTLFAAGSAFAGTSCVSPGGAGGCFSSIQAAVDAASPGDTINVQPGTYSEAVVIRKSLSLIGSGTADAPNTVIDASSKGAPGVNVDGLMGGQNAMGGTYLWNVTVSGFEVKKADTQGILVTNAANVTISQNHVYENNVGLTVGSNGPECPALPLYFAAGESFDCGEGIHLSGVSNSSVINNISENNAGGILLSDDTGQTHDNLVMGNMVRHNTPDCGITLASHNIPALYTPPPPGVFGNTILGNTSMENGLGGGDGAGVGLFAAAPGAMTYGNTVAHNTLTGNALPGVTMHGHAPGQYLDNNQIVWNTISGNAADSDAPTSGPTGIILWSAVVPVNGTVILNNDISGEDIGIAVAAAGFTNIHQNSVVGGMGVLNMVDTAASVNARTNWWGCKDGPGAGGCSTVSANVDYDPWLKKSPAQVTGDHGNHGKP